MATNTDSMKTTAGGTYMSVSMSPTGVSNAVSFTTRPRNVAFLYCVKN
ncbi:MAG: hypothetical protein WA194_00825 [Patescibacteria group bacterium]